MRVRFCNSYQKATNIFLKRSMTIDICLHKNRHLVTRNKMTINLVQLTVQIYYLSLWVVDQIEINIMTVSKRVRTSI